MKTDLGRAGISKNVTEPSYYYIDAVLCQSIKKVSYEYENSVPCLLIGPSKVDFHQYLQKKSKDPLQQHRACYVGFQYFP